MRPRPAAPKPSIPVMVFLSESAPFAQACESAGLVFVGPTAGQIRDFGLKHRAREIAADNAVPLLPGSGLLVDAASALREAERIGYPVMLKSTAGGGGIGMQLVRDSAAMTQAFESVERLARKNFSHGGAFLERFIERARAHRSADLRGRRGARGRARRARLLGAEAQSKTRRGNTGLRIAAYRA